MKINQHFSIGMFLLVFFCTLMCPLHVIGQNVTIGTAPSDDYASLSAFRVALEDGSFSGSGLDITATITSDIPESSAVTFSGFDSDYLRYNSITIRTDGANTISWGSATGVAFITFNSWSSHSASLTINGDDPTTSTVDKGLTIQSDAASGGPATIRFVGNGASINLSNLVVLGDHPDNRSYGVIDFRNGTIADITISNCDIGPVSGGEIRNGIFTDQSTSNVRIENCHFFDFASGLQAYAGIKCTNIARNWTIHNNRFFFTNASGITARATNNTNSGIFLDAGSECTITQNIIGGGNANGGSHAMHIESTSGSLVFNPIDVTISESSGVPTTIARNQITNIHMVNGGSPNYFQSISVSQNITTPNPLHTNVVAIEDNEIGSLTSTNNILLNPRNGSFSLVSGQAISASSQTNGGVINVQNNRIGGISISAFQSTNNRWYGLEVIHLDGLNADFSVINNTIGGSAANSLSAGRVGESRSDRVAGVYAVSANTVNVSNNVIENLTSYGDTGTPPNSSQNPPLLLLGIHIESDMDIDIYDNRLRNLITNNKITFTSFPYETIFSNSNEIFSGAGIYVEDGSQGSVRIHNNELSNIGVEIVTGIGINNPQSFHGILVRRGDAGSEISSNTIYNLSETGTNGKLIGLTQTGGEYTIQNNMIAIDGNGTMETYGLFIDSESGTTLSSVVRNNTLLLEGQGANGSSVTYLHSTNNTDNLELVNNIIFNNHQNADGYVYTLSNTDTGTRMSSNYNFLYNTATNRGIRIGGVDQTTSQWKNIQDNYSWILANNETNEHIIAPGTIFQDPTMGDLRINSSAGTAAMYVYGKGLSLSGFSTDHQGSARTTNTGIPITIGADEIPYPSGQSLSARMVGTIADGNTSNFVIANQAVASITWNANGGMLPSDFSLQHVTGQGVSEEFALSGRPPTELRSFMRMTPTGGSGNWIATVRYYYHPNVAGGVDPMDGMVLTRARNNTGMNVFDHVHNGITTGTEIDGRAFIQVSGVQGSEFDLPFLYSVSSNPVVTPVTLVAFIATPNEYQVLVQWETASEINNDYFEIERSYQGAQEFEVISKIQGNGTTNSPRSYSWTDSPSMLQSEIHYRLKQVDYDGTYEYFEPVRVEMENAIDQKVVAYPNPANQRVNLRWSVSKDRRLQLFNVSGALVKSFAERVIQQTTLNLKDLPRGVYYLNVLEEGNLKERVRIVK